MINEYMHLSTAEKSYVKAHPYRAYQINMAKNVAIQETIRRFQRNGKNDKSDAFRHCFWSSMIARDLGAVEAKRFTDIHESKPNNVFFEKQMDLHNNAIGIKIGSLMGGSNESLSGKCFKAFKEGKLKVIR